MLPRERNYLIDILNAAKLAQDFVADIDRETFEFDLMRQAAVTRQIEIIGEASRRISTESRSAIPTIPWDQIIEMRRCFQALIIENRFNNSPKLLKITKCRMIFFHFMLPCNLCPDCISGWLSLPQVMNRSRVAGRPSLPASHSQSF